MPETLEQVHGNDQVILGLERFLAEARRGQVGYAVIVVAQRFPEEDMRFGFYGDIAATRGIAQLLRTTVADTMLDRLKGPEVDPGLGAEWVCYDLSTGPASYDFIPWLVDAEMTRVREGRPGPLRVGFWMGPAGDGRLHTQTRRQMFANVIRPALRLLGAVEDEAAIRGRRKTFYTLRDVTAAVRAGEAVPRLQASEKAMACARAWLGPGPAPVTITLRELDDRWPHRNSNIAAWREFARMLVRAGEHVIFVRDTARSAETDIPHRTCPQASVDLEARCALYSLAKVNLFVANGPVVLAHFGDRPFLIFTDVQPDGHPYRPETPSFWRENQGIAPGEQFPWCRPDQRIVWAKDDIENIVAAWEALAL